ncbi:hypothetical protein M9H77_29767 [Catharanthus roseus]|uniref:Uncharacterized protein n=1 Tax=Catharanthus roseus TaxID=4058 RepID=A0ACB9ZX82_CATRO|nr:hypothetical protein M9H77_29767 [Catharanthus roseus]
MDNGQFNNFQRDNYFFRKIEDIMVESFKMRNFIFKLKAWKSLQDFQDTLKCFEISVADTSRGRSVQSNASTTNNQNIEILLVDFRSFILLCFCLRISTLTTAIASTRPIFGLIGKTRKVMFRFYLYDAGCDSYISMQCREPEDSIIWICKIENFQSYLERICIKLPRSSFNTETITK